MSKTKKKRKILKIVLGVLLGLAAIFNMEIQWLLGADSFVSYKVLKIQELGSLFGLILAVYIVYNAAVKKSIPKQAKNEIV